MIYLDNICGDKIMEIKNRVLNKAQIKNSCHGLETGVGWGKVYVVVKGSIEQICGAGAVLYLNWC